MFRILASFFLDLKGLVSEGVRAVIVRRFCRLMASTLADDMGEESPRRLWVTRDQSRFIRECRINDSIPKIPNVTTGAVNEWADKWLHVNKFRLKDGDGEWRLITPEQNALRVTMIHDLQNLTENDLTTDEKDGSVNVEGN
jgi:hypothetical protein